MRTAIAAASIQMKPVFLIFVGLFLAAVTTAEEQVANDSENREPVKLLIIGSLSPQGMENIGKPINVIDQAQIAKKQEPTIAETLSQEAGISSTYFGPGASRPVIRGQGKARVRVIENGLENGDVSATSDDHAITSDPLTTERIDILRGPSTLMFGSQAIGGVVDVIDESIATDPLEGPFLGKLSITAGDAATDELSGATVLKGQAANLSWYFSAFGRATNDLEIPGFAESDALRETEAHELGPEQEHHEEHEHEEPQEIKGKLVNSDSKSSGSKVGLAHAWNNGFFGVAVKQLGSEYGIPGAHSHAADHETEEEQDDSVRIDLDQTRIESRGAVHLHRGYLDSVRFGLAYSDYEHTELEGNEVGTVFDRDTFEARVLFTHHHQAELEGGLGLQVNYDDLSARGEEAYIPTSESFNPALFFIEDFTLNQNLVWELGGRYELAMIDPDEIKSEKFNSYSAATSLIWHNDLKTYSSALNLSYSERAPNVTELFANGVHVASQTFEIGDAGLDKEGSIGAELILRKLKGSTRGNFTAFIQEYNDYINLEATGLEEEDFPVFAYENVAARFWGFEAEAEQDLYKCNGHVWTLSAGFDLVRARNTDAGENLPRITPMRSKVGLEYSYDIFSSYLEAMLVDEQDRIAEFELPTDDYHLLTAGINLSVLNTEDYAVDFFIRGTNLTDQEARVHTSFLKDQAPLRGRAFFAGLTAQF